MEAMKFRRGAATDTLYFVQLPLAYVNQFPYLEMLFSVNGKRFTERRQRRPYKRSLVLVTAFNLLDIKMALIETNRTRVIWEENFKQLITSKFSASNKHWDYT